MSAARGGGGTLGLGVDVLNSSPSEVSRLDSTRGVSVLQNLTLPPVTKKQKGFYDIEDFNNQIFFLRNRDL